MDTKAGKGGSGSNSKSDTDVYTLLFMEETTGASPLHSTRNSTGYSVVT